VITQSSIIDRNRSLRPNKRPQLKTVSKEEGEKEPGPAVVMEKQIQQKQDG